MKTCKNCEYEKHNKQTDKRICTNPGIKHRIVGKDFCCSLWKEKE